MGFKRPFGLMILPVAITAAGCGGDVTPPVATAGGVPDTGPSADAVTAYVESVRAFVTCLRVEGVKVTDPDAKGSFTFEGDLALLKKDEKFVAAQEQCGDLLPPVPAGLRDKPVRTAEQIEMARQYAKCMRQNGAPDFPEPSPDGYHPDRVSGKTTWNQDTEGARRATRACASIVGDPGVLGEGNG